MDERAVIRVLVADDDARVLAALCEVVEVAGGMQVVATAAHVDDAVAAAISTSPDVAVLDVRIAGGGGARAASEIALRAPRTRTVALAEDHHEHALEAMLRAGALGYVAKSAPIDEIAETIRRAARGLASLSGEAAAAIVAELEREATTRERVRSEHDGHLVEVRSALAAGAIRPAFQPIVDLKAGRTVGFEALARFEVGPARGPDAWFRLADSVGLREDLELAAIGAAIGRFLDLPSSTYLSLNLSPSSVLSERLPIALLGIPAERLVLEITEHAEVGDYGVLAGALRAFRDDGGRLAVDDAGSGYASLRHILRLEPDIIKLDGSITRGIVSERAHRAMAASLVSFADEMGIVIVAEGVETAAELDELRRLGVQFGQGYFLGRPLTEPRLGPAPGAAGAS